MFCVFTALALWRLFRYVQKDIQTRKMFADKHVRVWQDCRNISVNLNQGIFGNYYSLKLHD